MSVNAEKLEMSPLSPLTLPPKSKLEYKYQIIIRKIQACQQKNNMFQKIRSQALHLVLLLYNRPYWMSSTQIKSIFKLQLQCFKLYSTL